MKVIDDIQNLAPLVLPRLAMTLLVALSAQAFGAGQASARGQTNRLDEKHAYRIVRLTPSSQSYQETHFSLLKAFNQANDKVLLWGPRGPEWGTLDKLTSWESDAEFQSAVHRIPWSGRVHTPIWSELPNEEDVLYRVKLESGVIVRIDLRSGTSTDILTLPGAPQFSQNFFMPGFSSDGKLIVWEDPDDLTSRGWEVDPKLRTVRMLSMQPTKWTTEWMRLPYVSHGHSGRSPDGESVISTSADDIRGYTSYLLRRGARSIGLGWSPSVNHVSWLASNRWAVFDDGETGSIYQVFPDGSRAKLLDLKLSKVPISQGGYYRDSSFPNVSRDGRMILYSSDGGAANGSIGIFIAFLEDANPGDSVQIERFEAWPSTILSSGAGSVLRWVTRGATGVTIAPGAVAVSASDSMPVMPAADTAFELTATGPQGPVRQTVLVKVAPRIETSLIPNGSMESGALGALPTGWSSSSKAVLTADDANDFSKCVRVTSDRAKRMQGKIWAYASEEDARRAQGHRVTLRAFIKSAVPRLVHGDSLQIQYGDPLRTISTPIEQVFGDQWTEVETSVVLPADVKGRLGVAIAAVGGWEDASAYVDRVSLQIDDTPSAPSIERFEVVRASDEPEGTLTVAWRTRGASSAVLMPAGIGLAPVGEGYFVLGGDYGTPRPGATLRLVAQGPGGTAVREVRIDHAAGPANETLLPPATPGLAR